MTSSPAFPSGATSDPAGAGVVDHDGARRPLVSQLEQAPDDPPDSRAVVDDLGVAQPVQPGPGNGDGHGRAVRGGATGSTGANVGLARAS
jgi:hypothetical protein